MSASLLGRGWPMHHLLTHVGRWGTRRPHALVHWRAHLVTLWRWPLVIALRRTISHRWRWPSHAGRGTRRKSPRGASHLWRTTHRWTSRGKHRAMRAIHVLLRRSHLVRTTHGRCPSLGWASHWRTARHGSSNVMWWWRRSIRRRSTRGRAVSTQRWGSFLIGGFRLEVELKLQTRVRPEKKLIQFFYYTRVRQKKKSKNPKNKITERLQIKCD